MWLLVRQKLATDFGRAISVLVSGSAAAQLLAMLAMPILSRLYSPSDFGVLAVFVGIVTTVAVGACLRFEIAIPMPVSDDQASHLVLLSAVAAVLVSIATYLLLLLPNDVIKIWLADQASGYDPILIPIGILCVSMLSVFLHWQIRCKGFSTMARAKLSQSAVTAVSQGAASVSQLIHSGLVFGYLLGFFVATIYLGKHAISNAFGILATRPWRQLWQTACAYRSYPIYSTWEAVANQAAIHVPILMIAIYLDAAEAGYLAIAMYVMQAPMSLFGGAVGQAYLANAVNEYRQTRLHSFTKGVVKHLFLAGALPILIIGILAPFFFPLVFGEPWVRAGWLVLWMTPWFLAQFLVSPVSMALHIVGAQKSAMIMQIAMLILRVVATGIAIMFFPALALETYALSGALAYGAYLCVVFIKVRNS